MGKHSVLVWNSRKSQRTILNAPRCTLPETSINRSHEGLTKFYSIFVGFFKESGRVHDCPSVSTLQKRGEWNNQPRGATVTDKK